MVFFAPLAYRCHQLATHAAQDQFGHIPPNIGVAVEADAVGMRGQGRWLADIMQQDGPGQLQGGLLHLVEHQGRMLQDIPLGVKLGWLGDRMHRTDLEEQVLEQA